MDASEVGRLRRETRGCGQVLHFNNAGSSLMPDPVFNAVCGHLELEAGIGGYEAMEENHALVDGFYGSFARLLNCAPEEIAFVENATRAWDMAFYSIPFQAGDRILTARAEYVSNYLAFLQTARRHGVDIDVVPDDGKGQISLQQLEAMIDDRVKLIAVTHVPTNSGLVNPVAAVGRIANRHDVLYLLDACQSLGQMPVDVQHIGCDILSGTGRKFLRGPRGTGVLFVNKSVIGSLDPPFVDLHSAAWTDKNRYQLRQGARRFENWERNVAGQIGLARAVEYAMEVGLDSIWVRVAALAERLRESLNTLDGVVTRDVGDELCGIVTFTKDGADADYIQRRLHQQRINVDVCRAANARLNMEERGLSAVVRASVHYFNTDQEIDRFCDALAAL